MYQIALNVNAEEVRNDKKWFRKHSSRCFRLRHPQPNELSAFGGGTSNDRIPAILVQQLMPGYRHRHL